MGFNYFGKIYPIKMETWEGGKIYDSRSGKNLFLGELTPKKEILEVKRIPSILLGWQNVEWTKPDLVILFFTF